MSVLLMCGGLKTKIKNLYGTPNPDGKLGELKTKNYSDV